MFNFCKHKYGKIEKGYQYCEKCNKAITVPCNHKWDIIDEIDRFDGIADGFNAKSRGKIYSLQCKICGDTKKDDQSWYRSYEGGF